MILTRKDDCPFDHSEIEMTTPVKGILCDTNNSFEVDSIERGMMQVKECVEIHG